MKAFKKICLSAVLFMIAVLAGGISAYADSEPPIYTVKNTERGFSAEYGEVMEFSTLAKLVAELEGDGVIFDFREVVSDEGITFGENTAIRGELTVKKGNLIFVKDAILDGCRLSFSEGAVEIKDGEVRALGANISSSASHAVMLDYSARSVFYANEARIYAESSSAAVVIGIGSATFVDSELTNPYGAAILSHGTLAVAGQTKLIAGTHGVVTSRPFYASAEGKELSEKLTVLYGKELGHGAFCEVVLGASEKVASLLTVAEKNGERVDIKYFEESEHSSEKSFVAVYMPYRVKFYNENEPYLTCEYIGGESAAPPASPEKGGYSFDGWYRDASLTERYSFTSPLDSDISLFAAFSLLPPKFSISSESFVFSEEARMLGFDELSHPLADEGAFSFTWYKDGEELSISGGEVELFYVQDSGIYECRIGFCHGADIVFVTTPKIEVQILPKTVPVPSISDLIYTGSKQIPTVNESPLYSATPMPVINAGSYTVAVTLLDPSNYAWGGVSGDTAEVEFQVLPATNKFLSLPTAVCGYEGTSFAVKAESLFGTPKIFTSRDGEEYAEGLPTEAGKYLLLIKVEGTDNYSSLESDPIELEIFAEIAVGLKVVSLPDKTEYLAFEKISLQGAEILVTYNSGRSEIPKNELFSVEYGNGEHLLVNDRCVNIVYGNLALPISVTVLPRSYDIDSIKHSSLSVVYNGAYRAPIFEGEVIGSDGIPLEYKTRGGGTDAGSYIVTLEFSTESRNYLSPDPIAYTFEILPMPLEVVFEGGEFVYDGTLKSPRAFVTLATGQRISLSVSGAASDAGEYTAAALFDNKNYELVGNEFEYKIDQAILDLSGAYWSGGGVPYDGTPHSVRVEGLPDGVSVLGYLNASFTDAGSYVASAILSYDEKNYRQESLLCFEWEILAADYSFGDFAFVDTEAVFDGEVHYPKYIGALPVGLDGSSPSFRFASGARDVSDGKVAVKIIFESTSKNYKTPDPVSAFVRILPKRITVEWSETSLIYSGEYCKPSAKGECEIEIIGHGLDAGEYTVEARALDQNYEVINSKCLFVIEKSENSWHRTPAIADYFTSGSAYPLGEAVGGETLFSFFTDKELTSPTDAPLLPGTYYMVASAKESKNYYEISSDPIEFRVVAVEPIRLSVKVNTDTFRAMQSISAKDITAYFLNNDGSQSIIPFSDIEIVYQTADSLRFGDNGATFIASGFECVTEMNVIRAEYDMSSVHWESEYHFYDGTEKCAYLTGLPEGVTLVEYSCNSATNAGSYKLSAVLGYDTENYYPPRLPDAWLVISPAPVSLPEISDLMYNGKAQMPDIEPSELYTFSAVEAKDAGVYSVSFTLTDPANYAFAAASCVEYRILPLKISAELNERGDGFTLTSGVIIEGDELCEEYYREGGMIYLRISNPNYELSVSPVKAKSRLPLILTLIIIGVLFLLAICILIMSGRAIPVFAFAAKKKEKRETAPESAPRLETLLAVDAAHANGMITDAMAKSLVEEGAKPIETEGRARATVNVDKLSSAFSAGDTVDINSMKERGVIAKDVFYVKVLAGGVIDKPLSVMANSFSASAVKMIALTGGHAYKTKTARGKKKKSQ